MNNPFVISDSFIAPALIVLFSYLIWVQSYQNDIADFEHVIRERYENQEFPSEAETEVVTIHVRCEELDNWRYRIERIFNPFRDLEGHTSMHLWVVNQPDLTWDELQEMVETDRVTIPPQEGKDFQIFMHAVEPQIVSGVMEELFSAIYVD